MEVTILSNICYTKSMAHLENLIIAQLAMNFPLYKLHIYL